MTSLSAEWVVTDVAVFDGASLTPPGWLSFTHQGLTHGQGAPPQAVNVIDGKGGFVSPPLLDTHTHGGGGFSAERGAEDMAGVINFHSSRGVKGMLLSLMTDSLSALGTQLESAASLQDERFLGIHLEGPFLSQDFRGCHPPDHLQKPSDGAIMELLSRGEGVLKSITVAPELLHPHQLERLVESGIQVCLGHTSCDYETARAFFSGAPRIVTHAFNAMPGIHHRSPGPVLAALESGAYTELIADGHHVVPAVAHLLNPEKVILVTDAIAATGQGDGDYALGTNDVRVRDGVARDSSGSLAGSTLLLHEAVTNYARWSGSPEHALRAATKNPAEAYALKVPSLDDGILLWNSRLGFERIL